MIKAGYVNVDNYKALLAKAKTLDRHDIITIHYIPIIVRLTGWTALESNVMLRDARSLHDSLMARLDRLHPVKEVAQTAAVIGRAFDHATIAALAALPEAELTDAMRRLVEADRTRRTDAAYTVFALLCVELWMRIFLDRSAERPLAVPRAA